MTETPAPVPPNRQRPAPFSAQDLYSGRVYGRAGDYLTIYCTGLGTVAGPKGEVQPGDGAAAPRDGSVLYMTTGKVTATIGGVPAAAVSFAGLTPGLAGLYQVNVQVPTGVAAGAAVPLVISETASGTTATSNVVGVAVQ